MKKMVPIGIQNFAHPPELFWEISGKPQTGTEACCGERHHPTDTSSLKKNHVR